MKRIIVVLSLLAVFTAFAAFAPPVHARSTKNQRIQACADKSAGDPCSYTRKGENVDGTCGTARHGKLICTASNAGSSESSGGAMTAPSGGAAGSPSGEPAGGTMGSPSGGSTGGTTGSPSGGGEAPAPSAP